MTESGHHLAYAAKRDIIIIMSMHFDKVAVCVI